MSLILPKQDFDVAIATKTARSVLERMFKDLEDLRVSEYTENWLLTLLETLQFTISIESGFMLAKVTILTVIKDRWDDLPFQARRDLGYDFKTFAKLWTGGKASSTIDQYTQTAKTWVIDGFGKGRQVEINERAADGKPIIEDGKIKTKLVEFEPYAVDYSKLMIMNARARKNDLTDKHWEMLCDPFYTCDDLRMENATPSANGNDYQLRYRMEGPLLSAFKNGESAPIGELNWEEYETNELVKDAIDHLLAVLNVPMDEDIIYRIVHESHK